MLKNIINGLLGFQSLYKTWRVLTLPIVFPTSIVFEHICCELTFLYSVQILSNSICSSILRLPSTESRRSHLWSYDPNIRFVTSNIMWWGCRSEGSKVCSTFVCYTVYYKYVNNYKPYTYIYFLSKHFQVIQ